MYRQQANILNNISMIVDALIVITAGYVARSLFIDWYPFIWELDDYQFAGFIVSAFFLNNAIMARMGLYSDRRPASFWPILWQVVRSAFLLFAVLSAILFFVQDIYVPQRFLYLFAALFLSLMMMNKAAMLSATQVLAGYGFNQRHILLVGNTDRTRIVFDALQEQQSWGHKVVGLLRDPQDGSTTPDLPVPVLGTLDDLRDLVLEKEIDEVIFALPPDKPRSLEPYLSVCDRIGLNVRVLPAMYDPDKPDLQVEVLQGVPLLSKYRFTANASGLFYKRILDIVAGGIGTFITFGILYPTIGIAIKLDSRGPTLFRQIRIGLNGRPFRLYKFRSMYIDAEAGKADLLKSNEMNGHMFKVANDPRITRVGRFMRKTSLDEFPQFLNVLLGQMSMVGTRPPTPDEVSHYEDWHRRRISIKPGITGLWQISGRNKITDFNEVVKLDLKYIDRWHFADDLKIMWKTIWVVLARKGAV
ncbi:MAG: sugar transferase [Pseudomonadota bacterium]